MIDNASSKNKNKQDMLLTLWACKNINHNNYYPNRSLTRQRIIVIWESSIEAERKWVKIDDNNNNDLQSWTNFGNTTDHIRSYWYNYKEHSFFFLFFIKMNSGNFSQNVFVFHSKNELIFIF